jgi:hypothetical protein
MLLLAIIAFATIAPSRADSNSGVQKVDERQAPMDEAKTGVGSPASKVGPTSGASPSRTQMGSQQNSTPRASKVGPSDNPAEPTNPEHPPTK